MDWHWKLHFGAAIAQRSMKMAIQFHYNQGNPHKNRFGALRNGYHGDTFGAMSVCDPDTGMHHIYSGVLPQYYFADAPNISFYDEWNESDIESFRKCIIIEWLYSEASKCLQYNNN